MSRRLSLVVTTLAAGLSLASCNNVTCGKGTVQSQNSDGTVQCVQVDSPGQLIKCDTDGGASIVGGVCTSAIKCGPGTSLVNGVCVGTGGNPDEPPVCPPPDSTHICINGVIRYLDDNSIVKEKVHVVYYDNPFNVLTTPEMIGAELDTDTGTYIFTSVAAPALPLMAIAAGDSDIAVKGANAGAHFVETGAGAQNVSGGTSYRIDIFALKRSVVDGWTAQSGINWYANGGYLARFYSDAKPADNNLAFTEKSPVSGVQLLLGSMPQVPPAARYFSTDIKTLDASATVTSAVGAALAPAPPAAQNHTGTFTGMGGGITWESETGGSTNHVIFVARFHPNM